MLTHKSTSGLSVLPFCSLFANCLIWLYYGILIDDPVVYGPNALGLTIATGCILVYERVSLIPSTNIYIPVLVLCVIASYFGYVEDGVTLGYIGAGLTILLMGSPLATLQTVIRDKSTASLPLVPSAMSFFNSYSWMLYGFLIANDPMVSEDVTTLL
jgi:solute carrier family 50 (sugar transporter)